MRGAVAWILGIAVAANGPVMLGAPDSLEKNCQRRGAGIRIKTHGRPSSKTTGNLRCRIVADSQSISD
jgi:hypothetical protein